MVGRLLALLSRCRAVAVDTGWLKHTLTTLWAEGGMMASIAQSMRTVLFLGILTGVLLFIGGIAGGATGIGQTVGVSIALGVSLVVNLGAWFFSDRFVIRATKAQEVQPNENPRLHRMVEDLARNAGIPKPRVYYVPDHTPNAFATGRGPSKSVVAVTHGLLELLSEREIRGVLAHEIAHIKDRDVLISSIAAAVAGAIVWLAVMLRWIGLFAGFGGRDDNNGGNILVLLLLSILAPIIAMFIRLAISRSREYKADAVGAAICRDPNALADALERLERGVQLRPMRNQGASTVHFICNPFKGKTVVSWFSTHPPMEKRIARLRFMAREGRARVA